MQTGMSLSEKSESAALIEAAVSFFDPVSTKNI
jgi:hypothetical protein